MLLSQAVASPDTAVTLNTVIDGFAAVVSLFVLNEFWKLRDWRVKNEQMPAALKKISDALWGDEKGNIGLIAHLKQLAIQLDEHCNDEREFWDEVKDGRDAICDKATAAVLIEGEKIREDFSAHLAGLTKKVDSLMKQKPKR